MPFQRKPKKAEVSHDLRRKALEVTAAELRLTPGSARQRVWGILMETGYSEAVATLVVFADGTTSLYFSTGGGVIGAGEHDVVRAAAGDFLAAAEAQLHELRAVTDTPLPTAGRVRFYVRTFDGTLTAEAAERELGEDRHVLASLFHAGHAVIARVREASQRQEARKPRRDWMAWFKKSSPSDQLIEAVREGDATRAEKALADGADPNARITDESENIDDAPVIQFAAAGGSLPLLRRLKEKGADVNAADGSGLTPLMCAAFMGQTAALDYLLQNGANREARDGIGYTALMFASNAGKAESVRRLLAAGADPNARDDDGSTPIMFAAQHGFDDCVRLLLAAKADPMVTGSHGLSAIAFAQQNGHESTERLLTGAPG